MVSSVCSKCGTLLSSPATSSLDLSVDPGSRQYMLMHSNEPPGDSEKAFIRSNVSRADERMACVDEEISSLRQRLKQLEEERVCVDEYRTRNKAILLPLRWMPAELLAEIFLCTPKSHLPFLPYATDIPWVASHVSRGWRAVSLSTPSLWSPITIDYGRGYHPDSPLQLEAQIQRAHPLGLRIHFFGRMGPKPDHQIQMLELLLEHSSRWQELSICLTSKVASFLDALRDGIQISSLKRLWIEWDITDSPDGVISMDCFSSVASLTHVGLNNVLHLVKFDLPTNLTHYDVNGPWHMHTKLLKLTPFVVQAYIVLESDDNSPPGSVQSCIVLEHLQRLYTSSSEVLNCINAPNLIGLTFQIADSDSDAAVLTSVRTLVQHSACVLRRLCMIGLPRDNSTTLKILDELTAVTDLLIGVHSPDTLVRLESLVSSLTVSEVNCFTVVAPRIRSLSIGHNYHNSPIQYQDYFDMIQSRWDAENCDLAMATLALGTNSTPDSETFSALDAIRRQGFRFTFLKHLAALDEMDSWEYTSTWGFTAFFN
ncbi:ABC protein [Favolaschia claudopus]|uniref:ABC protein n=1 Tax=Favolaschia claudopus TaxID=2862362 RepID=A0AAW0BXG6_9AGAR